MATIITVENRPTEPGLYFLTASLPTRMSLSEAKSKLAGKMTLPVNSSVISGMLVYDDAGVEKPVTLAGAQAAYLEGTTLPGARWSQQMALLGTNGIVNFVGFYVLLMEEMPPSPGLSDVMKTEFDEKGNIVAEYDSQGNKWTPQDTVEGYDELGAVFAIPLLWSALAAIGFFLFKVLIALGIVAGASMLFFPASKKGKGHAQGIFASLAESIKKAQAALVQAGKSTYDTVKTVGKWVLIGLGVRLAIGVVDLARGK